jgi:arylamine N-acetyltransferase
VCRAYGAILRLPCHRRMAVSYSTTPPLGPETTRAVLAHLGVTEGAPDLALLDQLVQRYKARVPWETTTRIVKRARTAETDACPRWPEEFWADAVERGQGGTCYESNYAFFSLLRALGYDGYLTLNNMRAVERPGCHAAIILDLDSARWLADVGYSSEIAPLCLTTIAPRAVAVPAYECRAEALAEHRYEVRVDLPVIGNPPDGSYAYSLIDEPVSDADYRAALTADYGPDGLFLGQVIVCKVIDGQPWRFSTMRRPPGLWSFAETWTRHEPGADVAVEVAARFGLHEPTVRAALEIVGTQDLAGVLPDEARPAPSR